MRTIKTKWKDRCYTCKGEIPKDSDAAYDDDKRRIYHNTSKCLPAEAPDTLFPDPKAVDLADTLGFEKPKKD